MSQKKLNAYFTKSALKESDAPSIDQSQSQKQISATAKKLDQVAEKNPIQNEEQMNNNAEYITFYQVASVYEQISEIKGNNSKDAIKEIVSKLFLNLLHHNQEEIVIVYLFSILKLGPDYEKWELGIGQTILIKAIGQVSGKSDKQVRDLFNSLGDLGLVAEKAKASQPHLQKFFQAKVEKEEKDLSFSYVFKTLQGLKLLEGTGSATEKENIITSLIRKSKPIEAKFIIRFLEKNLKIGAAEKTMQSALSRAFSVYYQKTIQGDFESHINQALCECPNYAKIINTLLNLTCIEDIPLKCHIVPGVPCKPMLAKPMRSIQMIFNRFENMKFTCEYKYDGLRGQIHFDKGNVSIFSRNLENMSQTYPDIIEFIKEHYSHHQSFIVDSEIIAYDVLNHRILPFQVLSSRAKKKCRFHIAACSSEDFSTPVDYLSTQQHGSQRPWECSRTADFPVEIILRFHYRIQLDHILLACKQDKIIPKVEFYIGDGLNGGFNDAEYRKAGSSLNVSRPIQIKLIGIGSFLKMRFTEKPKRSPQNPYGQISISVLKIWGTLRTYTVMDHSEEVYGAKDNIDKILIDMGIPTDMLNWFEDDDRNYEYAPIDDDTRETLADLKAIRDQARTMEDFEALKELKKDMKLIFEIGKEIWKIKRELGFAVAKEDYLRAMELRNRLKMLEAKRDSFDALYETKRYEKMVSLKRPTTAEYLRHLEYLELQEQMNADALRRQRELEEQNRRRLLKEEQDKLGKQTEVADKGTPWWDKTTDPKIKKKAKKVKVEEEDDILNFNNPFAFNQGDVDLELYLNPLLASAGDKITDIPLEILRRLHQLGYLTIFGAKAWTGIHSDSWRVREACAQAVLNFLEMPLPDKYLNGKSKRLFLASMEFAKLCMDDKILSIYFIGLKILSTALAPPVCGTDVSPAIINKVLKEFTPILVDKIQELNFRAREISLHSLLSVYRHPASNVGILINACFDKLVLDPNFPKLFVPPDKQPTRIVQARLEIVLNVLQEFGYDQRQFSYQDIFFILATPCLFHQSNEIRLLSIEVIAALYQFVGMEVRLMVESIENLKPGLKQQVLARLDKVDTDLNRPQGEVNRGLSSVPEQEEDELQTSLKKQQD